MWHNFNLHEPAKHGCFAFIIDAVKDKWIHNLRHDKTIYIDVTTMEIIDNFQLRCGGLHALDVVNLTCKTLT